MANPFEICRFDSVCTAKADLVMSVPENVINERLLAGRMSPLIWLCLWGFTVRQQMEIECGIRI